jgi:hypothetical protein
VKLDGHKDEQIRGNNRAWLDQHLHDAKLRPEHISLLQLVADMLDLIAKDNNIWMTIGATKNHSSFTVSIKGDLGNGAIYGRDLGELGKAALDLL